jgi:hypothetical protein
MRFGRALSVTTAPENRPRCSGKLAAFEPEKRLRGLSPPRPPAAAPPPPVGRPPATPPPGPSSGASGCRAHVARSTRHLGFSGPMPVFSGATGYFPDQSGHAKSLRHFNVYSGAMGYRDTRCCRVPRSTGISSPTRPGRAFAVAIAPENGPPCPGNSAADPRNTGIVTRSHQARRELSVFRSKAMLFRTNPHLLT